LDTENSVIIISGTSRGIGRALAEHYLSRGYIVHGCSRSGGTINHASYFHEILNIAEENSVIAWIRKIKRTGLKIESLICNAGTSSAVSLFLITQFKQFSDQIQTNFAGTFLLCREVGKVMMQQKYGRILTISSVLAGMHETGTSVYSASKKAIEELTKILAKEVVGFNVTCNCIAPGMVITPLTTELGENAINNVISKQTINRAITTSEICNIADFFLRAECSAITGQVMYIGFVN
jgi:3-oxoacyl-[acyl-carrier protein] reductase